MNKYLNSLRTILQSSLKRVRDTRWMVATLKSVAIAILVVGTSITTAYVIKHNDERSVEDSHSVKSQEVTPQASNDKSDASSSNSSKGEAHSAIDSDENHNDATRQGVSNTQSTNTNHSPSSSSSTSSPTSTHQDTSSNSSYDAQGRPMCGLWKSVYYTGASNTGTQLPYGEADYIPWSTFPNETMAPTLITTGLCSSDFKDWTYGAGSNWCKSENGHWEGNQFVGQYQVCKITSFEKKQL